MRFLLDQNVSPSLADLLIREGHDVVHARDVGLSRATDEEVMAAAADGDRVIISADTDFGELLSRTNAAGPSLLLLRRLGHRRAVEIGDLILANLGEVTDELLSGAIVVLDTSRIRVRNLPLDPTRQS